MKTVTWTSLKKTSKSFKVTEKVQKHGIQDMNLRMIFILIFTALQWVKPVYSQTQIGQDIEGEYDYDYFGYLAAISDDGKTIGVSANAVNTSPYARIFTYNGNSWNQLGSTFTNSGNVSVSGDGNTIAVQGISDSSNEKTCVRIYRYSNSTWNLVGAAINAKSANDAFGLGMSLSDNGEIIAVGARAYHGSGTERGQIRIFKLDNGSWVQLGSDINGKSDGEGFGSSVSLSDDGTKLVAGASENPGGGITRGQVRIYSLVNNDWVEEDEINGDLNNNSFGRIVSISGDGLTFIAGSGNFARVYSSNNSNWTQRGSDIAISNSGANFNVSLSDDANSFVIGSQYDNGGGIQRGRVQIYAWENGAWSQKGNNIDGEYDYDYSGESVALSGDGKTILVGSHLNPGGGLFRGHVRVFSFTLPCGANDPTGQNVLNGSITLSTQTQVNAFFNSGNNEKWTKVNGDLTISGNHATDPITNLCNLSELTEVTGYLLIQQFTRSGNPSSLASFSKLSKAGRLTVITCPTLVSIEFPELSGVAGSLNVRNNRFVKNILFPKLSEVGGELLMFTRNHRLENLTISDQAASFALSHTGNAKVEIQNNGDSTSMPLTMNLNKLSSVSSHFVFNNNKNIGVTNFDNIFSGLTHIGGNMTITGNTYLNQCCVAYNTSVSGSVNLSDNAGDCADWSAVTSDCSTMNKKTKGSGHNELNTQLVYYPNPNNGNFRIQWPTPCNGEIKVSLFEVTGKNVFKNAYFLTEDNTLNVDTYPIAPGTYILGIETGGNVQRFQMLIRK